MSNGKERKTEGVICQTGRKKEKKKVKRGEREGEKIRRGEREGEGRGRK